MNLPKVKMVLQIPDGGFRRYSDEIVWTTLQMWHDGGFPKLISTVLMVLSSYKR